VRWKTDNIVGFALIHIVAALALLPWFFSWTGVALCGAGVFAFGILGINLCFHRLLTHRGFECPLWLEHAFALFGACSMQDSPPHWVAAHRKHHQFADDDSDPHSPVSGFLWAHMGWLLVKVDDMSRRPLIDHYARDIIRDPFFAWLERRNNWMRVAFGVWIAYFLIGFGVTALSGRSWLDATQFGLSLFVWGGALRTVIVWHYTWSINSITHIWGYRTYETADVSRNNALIALITAGEGWHNNHHADSRSARHGHEWWELDVTWIIIRTLSAFGLAWNIATPSSGLKAKFNKQVAAQL
jgi:fatty-acid desaturase